MPSPPPHERKALTTKPPLRFTSQTRVTQTGEDKGIPLTSEAYRQFLKQKTEAISGNLKSIGITTMPSATEEKKVNLNSVKSQKLSEVFEKSSKPANPKNCVIKRYKWENSHNGMKMVSAYGSKEIIPSKFITERYKMVKTIGEGAYACVKLAVDKDSQQHVAVKMYEKYKLYDKEKLKNIKRETAILKQLEHLRIIKLLNIIEDDRLMCLVMEYAGDESLAQYLKNKGGKGLSEFISKALFKQMVEGMTYVHSKGYAHRDIKLENILINEDDDVKVVDFGFAISIAKATAAAADNKMVNLICGTPYYMAPESLGSTHYFGASVDVWALGVVLYTILTGHFPFKGVDNNELFRNIRKGVVEYPSNLSGDCVSLLTKIFELKAENRITCEDILNEDWLLDA